MRHFETRKLAKEYAASVNVFTKTVHVYKKKPGESNRIKKPFLVCTALERLHFC